jgi:iron complex transport system substrate-binding protein
MSTPKTTQLLLAVLLGSASCKGQGHPSRAASVSAVVVGAPTRAMREVEDLAGRRVLLPTSPTRVLTFGHSFAPVVALAPDVLVVRPGPFKADPQAAPFLPTGVAELPQIGTGPNIDPESIKALHFDLAVGWNTAAFQREQLKLLDRVSVPAVLVGVDRLDQYPATFRFLGRVLGREQRAEQLARYIEDALARMKTLTAAIPVDERLKVYYAEGVDGLTSQCGLEGRAEVIRLAGALNVLSCEGIANSLSPVDVETHNAPIALEALLVLSPDVIVTRFDKTAQTIRADTRWQRLRAVKEGRVYAIPHWPFGWFDRPPSFMRAMGMQWLAKRLYPKRDDLDLDLETAHFYSLFFGVTLDPAQLRALLGSGAE